MAIGLKNAGNLLMKDGKAGQYQQDLVNLFDFNVIEACVSQPLDRSFTEDLLIR
jgi:hypothetical protein